MKKEEHEGEQHERLQTILDVVHRFKKFNLPDLSKTIHAQVNTILSTKRLPKNTPLEKELEKLKKNDELVPFLVLGNQHKIIGFMSKRNEDLTGSWKKSGHLFLGNYKSFILLIFRWLMRWIYLFQVATDGLSGLFQILSKNIDSDIKTSALSRYIF
jgi:hypothetical protein